jgi:hypothetical protein
MGRHRSEDTYASQRRSDTRFKMTDERIRTGEKYVDYLFKVLEQYVGSAKVFTGISTALLALPLFQLKTLVQMCKISGMPVLLAATGVFLGISVISGAAYQLHSTQLVEDEVENAGRRYDWYLSLLRWEFRLTLGAMVGGVLLMLGGLALFLAQGDASMLND